jgi:hypothetical protein
MYLSGEAWISQALGSITATSEEGEGENSGKVAFPMIYR